jgi:pyroglutamyl-peptidase
LVTLQKPTRTVLVTGFTPFDGEATNPSWEIVKALPDVIAGHRLEKLRVPTEFGRAIDVTTRAIDRLKPDIVLSFGQAGGRSRMSVERVAINIDDARIADNAGKQILDQPVRAGGPAAYFCTVPIKAMVAAMAKAEVPAEISNSAGTFVCNHLVYGVLHHIAMQGKTIRAGFIHVPFLESQIVDRPNTPAMSLPTMIEGAKAAIIAAIKYRADLKLVGGSLH